MASRTSLGPPAFHSFLKRQMSPPPSGLSEGVNTIGPGRQGKYLLVFHVREVHASWSHLQRCRCLQHPHLPNSGLHLGTTYPEAPKPGPPKQFPWLSLVRSCQCRHWPASQALHRKWQRMLAYGKLLIAFYSHWSAPYNILSDCLCWIFHLRGLYKT